MARVSKRQTPVSRSASRSGTHRPQAYGNLRKHVEALLDYGISPISLRFCLDLLAGMDDLLGYCELNFSMIPSPPTERQTRWVMFWRSSGPMWLLILAVLKFDFLNDVSSSPDGQRWMRDLRMWTRADRGAASCKPGEFGPLFQKRLKAFLRYLEMQERRAERQLVEGLANRFRPLPALKLEFAAPEADALIFFLKVYLPALLIYEETPCSLLQRAEKGERDAIQKVLSLDEIGPAIPGVRDKLIELLKAGKPIARGGVGCEPVTSVGLSVRNLKALLAGLMLRHSKLAAKFCNDPRLANLRTVFGVPSKQVSPLTVIQVMKFFDELAKDRTGFRDPDIEGSQAFKKMIQRYSKMIPFPDWTFFRSQMSR